MTRSITIPARGAGLTLAALFLAASPTSIFGQVASSGDPGGVAKGLHQLLMHDACTGDYLPQPDTCIHKQLIERVVTIGGTPGAIYDVRLRIRGLFEPTTITGGEVPDAAHPYYQVAGIVRTPDWSAWHIEVSDPKQTYWLNHYPKVGHTIYREDFEATIPMAAGATVTVRVVDGNDRQVDNNEPGLPDRMQVIEGVTEKALDGQMLRIDVVKVTVRVPS
ncbi:MAG: hypothetical protein ABI821_09025 [Pseudomonadota bacterium]